MIAERFGWTLDYVEQLPRVQRGRIAAALNAMSERAENQRRRHSHR